MTGSRRLDSLRAFESLLGCSLPSDYAAFLLDAAEPTYDGYEIAIPNAGGEWPQVVTVENLYPLVGSASNQEGFDEEPPFTVASGHSIYKNRREGDGTFPSDAVVIGRCYEDGIMLLIFVKGSASGTVALKGWMTLDGEDRDDPDSDVLKIADSFDAFVRQLHRQ